MKSILIKAVYIITLFAIFVILIQNGKVESHILHNDNIYIKAEAINDNSRTGFY